MKVKRIWAWLLVLTLLCGILPCALAEQPEAPAISAYDVSYTQDGFLFETSAGSAVYCYDCASGQRKALCSHPGCDHRPVEEIDMNEYHYSVPEFMNENPSLCYAARIACVSNTDARVMYQNKLYFFPTFYNGFEMGNHAVPLCVSEVEGETRMLTDLRSLFPEAYDPYAEAAVGYDGNLYYVFRLYEKKPVEGEQSIDPDPGLPFGSILLVKCSMDNGAATVLETFAAESNDLHFLGLYDGVLYYLISIADGIGPTETDDDYYNELRRKTRYSVQGINVKTGEKILPDSRLCDRKLPYGDVFDIVKNGMLYSIVLPESSEDRTALFLKYDLVRRETVLEYPFEYFETDFYPYRVLTDEIMLAFNFETGTFALRNLKTGEIKPLAIPGACIYGNSQTDWYDIFAANFQTDPIILDHRLSETEVDKAYVTAEELLTGNPQVHDFTDQ